METVAVIDFETTGLSPDWGDRPTEIAVVLLSGGKILDRFQSLMNPGRRIPYYVTQLTGISDEMVASAPPVETVIRQAVRFVGNRPIVAHNAAFDRKFWRSELRRLSLPGDDRSFACTMLLARRVYPESPNHKLGTLAQWLHLPSAGRAHRAMADAETAGYLLHRIRTDISRTYKIRNVDHELLARAQCTPRSSLGRVFCGC